MWTDTWISSVAERREGGTKTAKLTSKGVKPRQHAKHRRRAAHMTCKRVEHQVRLAYATHPTDAVALSAERLRTREELVIRGLLTVEELELLNLDMAIETAMHRLDGQSAGARQNGR